MLQLLLGESNLYLMYATNFFSQACTGSGSEVVGKDHTHFMVFGDIALAICVVIMLLFLKVDYKRSRANQQQHEKSSTSLGTN